MSRAHALLLLPALLLTGCTGSAGDSTADGSSSSASDASAPARPVAAELARPTGVAVVPGTTGTELAVGTSQALYASAPLAVLAATGDGPAQTRAASFAVAVGAPLLLTPDAAADGTAGSTGTATDAAGPVREEVERLGAGTVLAFGGAAAQWASAQWEQPQDGQSADGSEVVVVPAPDDPDALRELAPDRLGTAEPTAPAEVRRAVAGLPLDGATPLLEQTGAAETASQPAAAAPGEPEQDQQDQGQQDQDQGQQGEQGEQARLPELAAPQRQDALVVLAPATVPDGVAAVATARAAGADVQVLSTPDPRASTEAVTSLADAASGSVLALGSSFGPLEQLREHVETARTGRLLPGGGQLVLPGKLYVALYGHPGSDALGVLGEQGVDATVARAKQVAAEYEQAGSTVPVVPTFEIITTVASAALGDGDYSAESTLDHVRPLVEAAGREGIYVVLDLQPGYDDFLTQAKMYEELLALPHVGLALDPEWRLEPGQRHMQQIGSVSAAEVNSVVTWLADLVRDRDLPQKMLLLHQFKTFMLEDRDQIETTRPELSVVTQMDGHGAPGTKLETWNVLRPGTPPGMRWGWKNFYDEDRPTLTPRQTLQVEPTPVFVSYQ